MFLLIRVFFLIYVFIFSFTALGSTHLSLEKKIQNLITATGQDINVGIYFRDLDNKKDKYQFHKNRKFTPASTMKLFTAYSALHYLGSDFQYRTTLVAENSVSKNGVLQGDVSIKFSGDPTFTYDDLERMLKESSISKIQGDVIIDSSVFDDRTSSPGSFTWDDVPFCYAAPTSAVIINDNCSEAKMWPSSAVGKKAELDIVNPDILRIDNTVGTVKPMQRPCPYKSQYLNDNNYAVYGCIFSDTKNPIRLNFALPDNQLMAKTYIRTALRALGIELAGQVRFSKSSGNKILYMHRSVALRELLVPVMHDSLNLASASLFKYISYKHSGKQGSDENSEIVVKDILSDHGLDRDNFSLKDGSGSSRYNLISPKALVDLLDKAYHSKKISKDFIATLPSYGSDSTLKFRHVDLKYNHNIYAKTGTLRNTASLAGYYLPKDKGRRYAFAIMVNNHALSGQQVKELEDKILYTVLDD